MKLLFIVTEDWYFCSHRLALACAAKEQNYEVLVATRVGEHEREITQQGLRLEAVEFPRSALRPWRDLALILRLIKLCRAEQPDIIHNVALKPVLYGTVAAMCAGRVPRIINSLTGFGHVFTSPNLAARILRVMIQPVLGLVLRRPKSHVIVQNPDDREFLVAQYAIPETRITEIPGSGVDLQKFAFTLEPDGSPVVLFPGRLLGDKGLHEFVEAARRIKSKKTDVRFVLAGVVDPQNPSSLTIEELASLESQGIVELLGWRQDMPKVFAESHIVCLPSHREGLPKALIEAAATGRPIVTTDVPGCRQTVEHGSSGLIVQPGDLDGLENSLTSLIEDGDARRTMGARGRTLSEQFSIEQVLARTLNLYEDQLVRA